MVALWAVCSGMAAGQDISMPADLEQVDFYLHTVDTSDHIYDNFGHTAIRVHNRGSGEDMIYNWGIFDFADPLSFGFRFYKGILDYQLGAYPNHIAQKRYRFERRTVWEDRLNLTTSQKEILMRRLIWHMQPENRTYPYQYFFDNCSTRPRDYIDEAVGGRIRQTLKDQKTGETFRDMVRSHYQTNPEVAMSLDILMNRRIDREMSVQDKTFLPLTLREALLQIPSDIPQKNLLGDSRVLMEFPRPAPVSWSGGTWVVLLMIIPLVIMASSYVGMKRLPHGQRQALNDIRHRGIRMMGLVAAVFGLYTGLLGLLMPTTWAFSAHLDLHHNVNQWLFWPTDLLLCGWGLYWLVKGRGLPVRPMTRRIFQIYCTAHVWVGVGYFVVWVLGLWEQNVTEVVRSFLPISIYLYMMASRTGFRTKETVL